MIKQMVLGVLMSAAGLAAQAHEREHTRVVIQPPVVRPSVVLAAGLPLPRVVLPVPVISPVVTPVVVAPPVRVVHRHRHHPHHHRHPGHGHAYGHDHQR